MRTLSDVSHKIKFRQVVDPLANPTNVDHVLPYRIAHRGRVIAGFDQLDTGRVFQGRIDFRQVDCRSRTARSR